MQIKVIILISLDMGNNHTLMLAEMRGGQRMKLTDFLVREITVHY